MKSLDTIAVHAGEMHVHGAAITPIFQSATYLSGDEDAYDAVRYMRCNNTPSQLSLHEKLRHLEGAEAALSTASGMAAISATLLTLLSNGDHVLAQQGTYGGTHTLIAEDLPKYGIAHDFIDATRPDTWKAKLRPTTRAIYVESISNPLCRVADLTAAVAFAREHGILAIVDNTVASPVNFSAIGHGFDLSIHSATKYLNGHSDLVAGAVLGSQALIDRIRHRANHLGGSLDAHTCFLLARGIKTVALRVRQQNASALAIAQFLAARPEVAAVNYPGLPLHPEHARAATLFKGSSGLMSFELHGTAEVADRFIQHTTLPLHAPSLGGAESLLTRPARTSHSGMSRADREALGITDRLIRMSVGIEDTEDLMADLSSAMRAISNQQSAISSQ